MERVVPLNVPETGSFLGHIHVHVPYPHAHENSQISSFRHKGIQVQCMYIKNGKKEQKVGMLL